jgi:hypothetical protein
MMSRVEPSARCSEERRLPDARDRARDAYKMRRLPCPGRPGVPALSGGGTGVRGRGVDAMMLRSAEADPHVIEHTTRMGAEAPFLVA